MLCADLGALCVGETSPWVCLPFPFNWFGLLNFLDFEVLDFLSILIHDQPCSDLENSVMQKKIKIPKLSLSHVEDDGEVKDYGEEDLQLRHIKVTKSFLFLDIHWSDSIFPRAKEFQAGLLPHINVS